MKSDEDEAAVPSAKSVIEQLRSNPGYMAKHADRERRRDAHREEFLSLSAPILSDLAAVGLNYSSTEEMRRSGAHYAKAIPILIKWLPIVTNQGLKESIVRALSVPWAKPAAALPLIAEFQRGANATSDSVKWAIGNALAVVADDSVFSQLSEIVRDRRQGIAREMLVVALGNMKDLRAVDVLIELLGDDVVMCHSLIALGRLKAQKAGSYIESLLNHPRPLIRKEAKKAMEAINKSLSKKNSGI